MRISKTPAFVPVPADKYDKSIAVSNEPVINDELFLQLKDKVFKKQPELRNILAKYGDMMLYDYAKRYNEPNTAMQNKKRKREFIDTFSAEVKRLLGKEMAKSCEEQLEAIYRVTTTDHHGPLSEPGMVNSNIHEAIPYLNDNNDLKNIIVLGCANVSFDNDTFPRGLLFHSKASGETENQLAFFPRAVRPCPVIFYPSYTITHLENAHKRIEEWEKDGTVTTDHAQKLKKLLNEIYAKPSVLSCKYYSEQVTKTNFLLWNKIVKSQPQKPNLIYIEQEGIVNNLIDSYHIDHNTLIHKLIFSHKYHKLLEKHFDGIVGGFSIKNASGTFLFWALPEGQKYRVQLWKEGKYLVTKDGSYKIKLTPQEIRRGLKNKELIPSTLLSFIILSFYYGVRLVGGKQQTSYLTQMKKVFIKMLKESNSKESVDYLSDLRTNDLSINIESLSYMETDEKLKIPATGIDFVLYGDTASLSVIRLLSKMLTLKEVVYRAFPVFYKRFYRETERELQLESITQKDLEKYLGLGNTIIPSAKIV
jgi:hypothetical protein